MADSLPYLATPGSIVKCLEKISDAATPEKVTGDFVTAKLGIKGGTGRALPPFLKKMGFVNSDGTPSSLYKKFRNPSDANDAVAVGIKTAFSALYQVNEYCHELNDSELKGLVVQVSGQAATSSVVKLTVATFLNLKSLANFDSPHDLEEEVNSIAQLPALESQFGGNKAIPNDATRLGMNLSYTINLNLPATSDIAVFNAIFKSLKENLLDQNELE